MNFKTKIEKYLYDILTYPTHNKLILKTKNTVTASNKNIFNYENNKINKQLFFKKISLKLVTIKLIINTITKITLKLIITTLIKNIKNLS